MKTGSFIDMGEEDNYRKTNLKAYEQLVSKLLYLLYDTIFNIAFVVGQLSKRNTDLRVGDLKAVNKVVDYLKGLIYLKFTY